MKLSKSLFLVIASITSVLFYFLLLQLGLADKPATPAIAVLMGAFMLSKAIEKSGIGMSIRKTNHRKKNLLV